VTAACVAVAVDWVLRITLALLVGWELGALIEAMVE